MSGPALCRPPALSGPLKRRCTQLDEALHGSELSTSGAPVSGCVLSWEICVLPSQELVSHTPTMAASPRRKRRRPRLAPVPTSSPKRRRTSVSCKRRKSTMRKFVKRRRIDESSTLNAHGVLGTLELDDCQHAYSATLAASHSSLPKRKKAQKTTRSPHKDERSPLAAALKAQRMMLHRIQRGLGSGQKGSRSRWNTEERRAVGIRTASTE